AATYSITDTVDIHVEARAWQRPDLEVAGVVVAGQSTAFIAEQVDGLRAVIFVSLIITLLVSLAAGWIVSGRALRPLRSLAETTDEIGATGDLTRRLPPSNADDEVGALTASFNAMLERLQAARTELTESLRRQQQFVADASHELRSPLTTIRNNAGFLAERADASAVDRRDAVAEIGEESDRMARLVDDLLALARTDGDLAPDRRPLDLSALTRDVVGRSDINLEAPDPVDVNGDRDALYRLILILIENARRHGSPPVEIVVRRIDSSGVIEVRDHGPGLRIDEYDRVFDRFYQADSSRNREGAGLGLAIAREIVMAHQGAIAASNHPGGGAVFSVRLPAI
ncbi:MAG: HAMP domain-containing histidine kinase, partial [Acidimicrobiia bacterium]|nr:HAMP domain-containing histidine kinase [Acidimicrobiia bacterium]